MSIIYTDGGYAGIAGNIPVEIIKPGEMSQEDLKRGLVSVIFPNGRKLIAINQARAQGAIRCGAKPYEPTAEEIAAATK